MAGERKEESRENTSREVESGEKQRRVERKEETVREKRGGVEREMKL